MKKLVLFFLIISCALFLAGCNTPNSPEPGPGPGPIDITDGGLYTDFSGTDYPGAEINLAEKLSGETLVDISQYASVTVDATLYSSYTDEEDNTIAALPAGENKNLAQFTLLTGTGEWPTGWPEGKGNACGPTKYNMAVNGSTTWNVTADAAGVPAVLLIQINEHDFPGEIVAIKINRITFTPKSTGGGPNITVDHLYVLGNSDSYPGAEVNLEDLLGEPLLDISEYASVIVNATLYSDEAGETVAVKENASDNLAQFKLLKATGNWDTADNVCGVTKYNMDVDGPSTMTVASGAQGVPAILLLQANWADFPNAVKSIKVNSIEFTPKPPAGTVILDRNYPESDTTYMEVSGNQVTFKNAMYSDCAAQFNFPESWGATAENSLSGKTITFHFTIPDHVCVPAGNPPDGTDIEHQLHIQAAHNDSEKDKFNGRNDQPGQKYITLSGTSGSFTVSASELIAASQVSGSANDYKGPFVLDAVRIVNNGTEWNESGVGTHYRCKTYTLVFDAITISP